MSLVDALDMLLRLSPEAFYVNRAMIDVLVSLDKTPEEAFEAVLEVYLEPEAMSGRRFKG